MRVKYTPFGLLYTVVLMLSVVLFMFLMHTTEIPYIGCPFKNITGFPCPTCGITRMSMAFYHVQVWKAITFNPLIAVSLMLVPIWGVHDILVISGKIRAVTVKKSALRWGIIIVLALNWAYLIVFKI